MRKIIQLSTYPIKNPLHGGQIRVSQIRKFFEQKNCIVKSLSLSEMSHKEYSDNDILVSEDELKKIVSIPFCNDYATALISVKGKYFEFLKQSILSFEPDILMLEQVWLWPVVKYLLKKNIFKNNIKIIYSSQNVEYKTKKQLMDKHFLGGKKVEDIIYNIKRLEMELIEVSDFVICCTSTDADEFIKMGAKSILICNNGVDRKFAHKDDLDFVENILMGRKYAFFVGSAYPPNAIGFWEMMGESFAFIPPDCIVLVVGGVSQILESYMPVKAKLYSNVSLDRIKNLGIVSNELLAAFIEKAQVILLPITIGGGSNLKTAEAIASCKPVVATTIASRGFDIVNQLSNFVVTDNKEEFIKSVYGFLDNYNIDIKQINVEEKKIRETVYWENTLNDLERILK